jgi:antitoxin ParD1/3/4
MNVSLTDEFEQLIEAKLASGMYKNAAEVVREGLRLLKEKDERRAALTEELRRSIRTGLEQAARGETVPGSEAKARIEALLEGTE